MVEAMQKVTLLGTQKTIKSESLPISEEKQREIELLSEKTQEMQLLKDEEERT